MPMPKRTFEVERSIRGVSTPTTDVFVPGTQTIQSSGHAPRPVVGWRYLVTMNVASEPTGGWPAGMTFIGASVRMDVDVVLPTRAEVAAWVEEMCLSQGSPGGLDDPGGHGAGSVVG